MSSIKVIDTDQSEVDDDASVDDVKDFGEGRLLSVVLLVLHRREDERQRGDDDHAQ